MVVGSWWLVVGWCVGMVVVVVEVEKRKERKKRELCKHKKGKKINQHAATMLVRAKKNNR